MPLKGYKAHKSLHQDGGSDEVSVAALSGELADRQPSKTGSSVLGWTDEKLLKGAGAGNAPEEIDVPAGGGAAVAAGTYTGNGVDARQITVGFKCSMVVIQRSDSAYEWVILRTDNAVHHSFLTAYHILLTAMGLHATDGFKVGDMASEANALNVIHSYWAIAE